MSSQVFISHAHKDKHAVQLLAEELGNKGIHVLLDESELEPGDSWIPRINQALTTSDVVVVILGNDEPSPFVLMEAGMAFAQGKQIIPVVFGEHKNSDVFANLKQIHIFGESGIETAANTIVELVSEHDQIAAPGKFKF